MLIEYIIGSVLISSVLTGIVTSLIGFLIGIRCQNNRLMKKTSTSNETNIQIHATNSEEQENIPVYEEVKEKIKVIDCKKNIAYETITL